MSIKWVKVTNEEWVTVVDGIKGSVFNAPYLDGPNTWELYVLEDPIGWESTQLRAMVEVNRALTTFAGEVVKQSRGDRLEAASQALTILIEAWRLGNVTSDDYARHTARVYGDLMNFLAEKDGE